MKDSHTVRQSRVCIQESSAICDEEGPEKVMCASQSVNLPSVLSGLMSNPILPLCRLALHMLLC